MILPSCVLILSLVCFWQTVNAAILLSKPALLRNVNQIVVELPVKVLFFLSFSFPTIIINDFILLF